jgi:hypothetical protein
MRLGVDHNLPEHHLLYKYHPVGGGHHADRHQLFFDCQLSYIGDSGAYYGQKKNEQEEDHFRGGVYCPAYHQWLPDNIRFDISGHKPVSPDVFHDHQQLFWRFRFHHDVSGIGDPDL